MNREEIRNKYLGLRDMNEVRLSKLKKEQFIISMSRLLVFAGGGILSAIAFSWTALSGAIAAFLTVTFFLILVKKSAEYSDMITFTGNLASINDHEIMALDGDYTPFDGAAEL